MKLENKLILIKSYVAYSDGVSYTAVDIEIFNKQFKVVRNILASHTNSIGAYQHATQAIADHFKMDYTTAIVAMRDSVVRISEHEVGFRKLKAISKSFDYENEVK